MNHAGLAKLDRHVREGVSSAIDDRDSRKPSEHWYSALTIFSPLLSQIKCAKYWPQHDSESVKYGDCKVKLMSVEESQDVIAREFALSHKDVSYWQFGGSWLYLGRFWQFSAQIERKVVHFAGNATTKNHHTHCICSVRPLWLYVGALRAFSHW